MIPTLQEGWAVLRSDVVTVPTDEMYEAMRRAPLGDDNRQQDPTTIELEALAAEMLGKESAIFLLSGTMGNLVAVMSHTQRGQEIILQSDAHMFQSEQGSFAAVAGLSSYQVPSTYGYIEPRVIERAIRPASDVHTPITGLLCLENTHNWAGGVPVTPQQMSDMAAVAKQHGIPVHVDGARVFNAAVALDVDISELVRDVDSVTFCLSKGLSCPAGALLVGPRSVIDRARRVRKVLGGTLRQAGVLAACGIVALKTMVGRLADDHRNARQLAEGLSVIPGLRVDPQRAQTNMVYVDVGQLGTAQEFHRALLEYRVEVLAASDTELRLVTHRNVGPSEIDQTIDAFRRVVSHLG